MNEAVVSRPASRRRMLLTAGVGAAAALAGGGLAWWRLRPGAIAEGAPEGFWASTYETPDGARLAMSRFRGQHLLLNFWATWCPPCIDELPLLDAFQREQAGRWNVVGLAIDQPSAVRQFLGKMPVGFPIGMAGLGGTELGKSLGNQGGGLPFTVVFDPEGGIRQRRMGKLYRRDLDQWVSASG